MPVEPEQPECRRLIACGVFVPALENLGLDRRWPGLELKVMPASLHIQPTRLYEMLAQELARSDCPRPRTGLLYGSCFPGIDDFCRKQGLRRVSGAHCYEMLLGPRRFTRLMDETAGTFFAERVLLQNFEQHCVEPLELDDAEVRAATFAHYRRLIYIRQPDDPDLGPRAAAVADFLGLSLGVLDADYTYFEHLVDDLVRGGGG